MTLNREVLKLRRTMLRLTRKDLAEKVGVSERTIQNYESGKHGAPSGTVHKMAQVLGVSPNELDSSEEDREMPSGWVNRLESVLEAMQNQREPFTASTPPPPPVPSGLLPLHSPFSHDRLLLLMLLEGQQRIEARLDRLEALLAKLADGGRADGR